MAASRRTGPGAEHLCCGPMVLVGASFFRDWVGIIGVPSLPIASVNASITVWGPAADELQRTERSVNYNCPAIGAPPFLMHPEYSAFIQFAYPNLYSPFTVIALN